MRGKREDILRRLGGLVMAAALVASQLLGALAPQSIHTARLIEESGVAKPCGLPGATWLMR